MRDVTAEIEMTKLSKPDGSTVDAWVVKAAEPGQSAPDVAVFSGPHGSTRATEYARGLYARVNYRVHAEPGRIGGGMTPLRAAG